MKARLLSATVALGMLLVACSDNPAPPAPEDPVEARIFAYLDENVQPGQRVVVSDLVNDVFTEPEERAELDKLFNTFFKIPMFLVQFDTSTGRTPTLEEIAQQFNFATPHEADIMLRIMEADPRVPEFFDRDPASGEITSLDVEPILNNPRFGQGIERSLAGWEGKQLPAFSMETFDGGQISSADVQGRPYLMYVWFSNCPPCVQTSPLLVDLYAQYQDSGFEIIAANADRILELPYDDETRAHYVEDLGIQFVTAHMNEEAQNAFGGVSIFPTMFFVNREGVVVKHFVNFQEEPVLEEAIQATL